MERWASPPPSGALELLGPSQDPGGHSPAEVRAYAARLLGRAGDGELLSYLLQLVQVSH